MTAPDKNPLAGVDWASLLKPEFTKDYWVDLQRFVSEERSRFAVYPPPEQVLASLRLTQHAETKVVILGQDPYIDPGQAHGLAFSVPYGMPRPLSLRNIHDEMQRDLGIAAPDHGCLGAWARRGVLLLNDSLTVRGGVRGSHRRHGWERFTSEVIRVVDQKQDRVVFVLWGKHAQRKRDFISENRHAVICSSHPSPLSAYRGPNPFIRSRPFSRANEALDESGQEPIDWTLADGCTPAP